MGFKEEIEEEARQARTGDDWYLKQEPYILELRSPGIPTGTAFMTLPLGPEHYTVGTVFRQSVTPTLGGLVAEERGILWRTITVSGTFGLAPKFGFDSSQQGFDTLKINAMGDTLSGPAWTRRMVRNFFERYAALKADPIHAADTLLIWHDVKTDNHYVVVPEQVDIDRGVQRRFQYPYSMRLKAIAEDRAIAPIPAASLKKLTIARNAIAKVAKGVASVSASIQEASALLGEVRYFVDTIDQITDELATIVDSSTSFVEGVTDTISVGRDFIASTTSLLASGLALMEAATSLPDTVRQNYQLAADGLDAIAGQQTAFGVTYADEAAVIQAAEAGATGDSSTVLTTAQSAGPPQTVIDLQSQRVRSTDRDLVDAGAVATGRTFANYTGFTDYAIQSVDTLTSIAARFLGDGTRWYDIAIVNGLSPPYVSESGAPGTVRPGDVIAIPTTGAAAPNAIVSGGAGALGTDIALTDTVLSAPGRPAVDIAIDRSTLRDVLTVSGVPNLAQALQMRVWTERGHMPLLPDYGLRRSIGIGQTGTFLSLLRLTFTQTLGQDSRVADIPSIRFEPIGDLIEADIDIIPIGSSTARTITTSIL